MSTPGQRLLDKLNKVREDKGLVPVANASELKQQKYVPAAVPPPKNTFDNLLSESIDGVDHTPAEIASIDEALPGIVQLLENMEHALRSELPNIDIHLIEINSHLRQFPELLQLLSREQCSVIYQSLRAKTKVAITVAKSKTKSSKGLLDTGQSMLDIL